MSWWRKVLGLTPDISIKPEPLDINPSPSARAARNQQRILRLKQAIADGDRRTELREELLRRLREKR